MGRLKKHLNEVVNVTWNFAGRCEDVKDEILNAVLGLVGEAGEVADQHKKMMYHVSTDPDKHREKLVYELGDVYYYLLKLQDLHGISTKEVLAANRKKLASRHPELGEVTERYGKGAIK